jgi:hypothetical protein
MRGAVAAHLFLIISFSAASTYPDELPRSVLEMARAKQHNRDLLKRAPLYTCLETMSREQKTPRQRKPQRQDIVQVDVGIGARQEIYSWPGEQSFSSSDLGGLVGHGLLATGIFAAFARNIFVLDDAIVRPAGTDDLDGRKALHFTYSISSLQSSWNVNWLGAEGVVGESGEFWLDPASLTLLRLSVAATDFPPNLPLAAMTARITYQTVSIGSISALVPSAAQVVVTEINGTTHRDEIAFSQCRVFEADSKVADSPASLETAVEKYEAQRDAVPAGLDLPITLETGINAATVKLGEALTARLNKAVKLSAQLTAPRGALVKGRIREFLKLDDPPGTYQVGLEFNELDWPGHSGIFFAEAMNLQQIAGVSPFIARGSARSITTLAGLETTSTTERITPAAIPGVATFFLSNSNVIPKGFQMIWRTQKTKHL